MRKKIPFELQVIYLSPGNLPGGTEITRMKVYGGWVVTTLINGNKTAMMTSVFVADQDHGWIIPEPETEAPKPNYSDNDDVIPM